MADAQSVLIRGGRIFDPGLGVDRTGDLLIVGEKFSLIDAPGKIPAQKAARVIEAKGKWVMPGFIDLHVHLREPGQTHKETIASGTRAAVMGGFTSVACMANTDPVNDSAIVTRHIVEQALRTASCRVYPIGALSKGLRGEALAEIGGMVAEGAIAISDDGRPVMNSLLMRKAMEYARSFGIPIVSHSEDLALANVGAMNEGPVSTLLGLPGNPAAAEEIMVAREIALARLTGCRVHIAHLSTRLALEHVRRAKDEGLAVTCEVTPHHLALTDQALRGYDVNFKMAPPLRTEEDTRALQEALESGLIDCIATDHAPHSPLEKEVEFCCSANGITSLETAVAATFEHVRKNRISAKAWVKAFTSGPAHVMGLPHGSLKKGTLADVIVFDPTAKWTFSESQGSLSSNSPWIGKSFEGKVTHTLVGGKVIYEAPQAGRARS